MSIHTLLYGLKGIIAIAQRKHLASYKIASVPSAKYLQSLNLQKLSKDKKIAPNQDRKQFYMQLQQEALDGPLYSKEVISKVHAVPFEMDKLETTWLAGQLTQNLQLDLNHLQSILDWSRATSTNLSSQSYERAVHESEVWHENFKPSQSDMAGQYKTKEVVYKFPDKYTIVRVSDPSDLELEGELMGHCVGGYASQVESGISVIYSLRDPKNAPHVTIEADKNGSIIQIQGKQNTMPVDKYQPYVLTWLMSQPKLTGWYSLVRNWDVMHDNQEIAKKVMDHLEKDPKHLLERLIENGYNAATADYIIDHGNAKDLASLVNKFGLQLDIQKLKQKALALKDPQLLYEVLDVLVTEHDDKDKELIAAILATEDPTVLYTLMTRHNDIVPQDKIIDSLVKSKDPDAGRIAAKIINIFGWTDKLQEKVDSSKDEDMILDFYGTRYEDGSKLDIEAVVKRALSRNDPIFSADVLNTLRERIADPMPLMRSIFASKNKKAIKLIIRCAYVWKNPDIQKYIQKSIDKLISEGEFAGEAHDLLLNMSESSGYDLAKIADELFANGSTMVIKKFLWNLNKKSKKDLEGINWEAAAEALSKDHNTSDIFTNASYIERFTQKDSKPLSIMLDALCKRENDLHYAINFLSTIRANDDDIQKVEKAVLKNPRGYLINSLLSSVPHETLDLKKMEDALWKIGKLSPLIDYYKEIPSAEGITKLRKYLDSQKDSLDEDEWKRYNTSVWHLENNLPSSEEKTGFFRIAQGLQQLVASAQGN